MKKTINPEDFPFADLMGFKKKESLTEAQKLGKKLLEIAKQHKPNENKEA